MVEIQFETIRIEVIRLLYAKGLTRRELAKAIGVHESTLYNAINGWRCDQKHLDLLIKALNYLGGGNND